MARKRYTAEEIIGNLREAEVALAQAPAGTLPVDRLLPRHGIRRLPQAGAPSHLGARHDLGFSCPSGARARWSPLTRHSGAPSLRTPRNARFAHQSASLQERGTDMAWHVRGQSVEMCSCKLMCPCWISDTAAPDQDFCAGAFAWDVQAGASDGVDLAGTKVAFRGDWPGNFAAGQGTARLYIDASASAEQRRELEAIFSGQKGGVLEGVWGTVITTWLPAGEASIDMQRGDSPSVTVGEFSEATLQPLEDAARRQTSVRGAAVATALQFEELDLASSQGSRWTDPDLQTLEGDSGTMHRFDWSG